MLGQVLIDEGPGGQRPKLDAQSSHKDQVKEYSRQMEQQMQRPKVGLVVAYLRKYKSRWS